jgi:hypothetical protein
MPRAATLSPREILSAAWPLFKACVPVCLPLAIIGVAAGATPGAEAAMSAEGRGLTHSREWWALAIASTVLTLICYGAVLRHQLALAEGGRPQVLDSLRRAAVDVPFVVVVVLLLALPLLPAMLATAWRGFDVQAAILTVLAGTVMVYGWFAWPALVDPDVRAGMQGSQSWESRRRSPLAAMVCSVRAVRGRWRAVAAVAGALIAAVLVFVMLTGIFIGMVMELGGQATATAQGLAFSRWLMALILSVPVVYGGAVTVSAWRALQLNAASTPP